MNEEVKKTCAEIKTELDALATAIENNITAWNEASLDTDFRKMAKLDEKLKDLEKEYAKTSQLLLFTKLEVMDNPILEAIKAHSVPIIRHKDTAESGSVIKTRESINDEKQFDLYDFDVFCGSKASHNDKWVRYAENFNMLCCMHVAKELGVEDLEVIGKSYFISKTAQQVKLFEDGANVANPISSTQLLNLLQRVCDYIIYDEKLDENGKSLGNKYKVTSHDVAWLLFTYGRKDSKGRLTLKVADHKAFRKILGDVLLRIVTNGNYKVAYKTMIKK